MNDVIITNHITDKNTLVIIIDRLRIYEFRDITPRDMLYIHELKFKFEDLNSNGKDYTNSLDFLFKVCNKLLLYSNASLENELWTTFIEINKIIQELIMTNRLDWLDYLGFMFSSHNKSFIGLHQFMDIPAPIIMDCYDTMVKFYEMQEKLMKSK